MNQRSHTGSNTSPYLRRKKQRHVAIMRRRFANKVRQLPQAKPRQRWLVRLWGWLRGLLPRQKAGA